MRGGECDWNLALETWSRASERIIITPVFMSYLLAFEPRLLASVPRLLRPKNKNFREGTLDGSTKRTGIFFLRLFSSGHSVYLMKYTLSSLQSFTWKQCQACTSPSRISSLFPHTTRSPLNIHAKSFSFTAMSREPSRKSNMGRRNHHPYRPRRPAANSQAEGACFNPTQQPSMPTVEPPTLMDPRRLYSASSGGQEAKPYASLTGTLDQALLQGLDKMGFE